jgi:DNA replication protein DnaC
LIDAHDNLALVGPSGVGKNWLACAIGQKGCRDNRSVLSLDAGACHVLLEILEER